MADAAHTRRIIVAISGASGAVYGARLLQVLQGQSGIETHLVVSDAGWRNLRHELDMDRASVEACAGVGGAELGDVEHWRRRGGRGRTLVGGGVAGDGSSEGEHENETATGHAGGSCGREASVAAAARPAGIAGKIVGPLP